MKTTPVSVRTRSGITLTEILIAILIMGVGMVSLATLFPLGLLRMQRAMRDSRSTLLAESALSEIKTRNLLSPADFYLAQWYNVGAGGTFVDPWTTEALNGGVSRPTNLAIPEPGLPVCYDPLWWANVHYQSSTSNPVLTPTNAGGFARLGNGQGWLRPDPDGQPASAYGLQRITNFRPRLSLADRFPNIYPLQIAVFPNDPRAPDVASQVFASPDGIVFNGDGEEMPGQNPNAVSPVVPDLTLSGNNTVSYDLNFTWFFTGYRVNSQAYEAYAGSIVVCHNRPMALETVTSPFGGNVQSASGERVVEAVWGYSGPLGAPGYGRGEKTVLLRWPDTMADPMIRLNGFLADVTYEISATRDISRFRVAGFDRFPGQRCDWYRIMGYTPPEYGDVFQSDPANVRYRQTIVTLDNPVKARTPVSAVGHPLHVNAALIMPSVVNVWPRTVVNRGN